MFETLQEDYRDEESEKSGDEESNEDEFGYLNEENKESEETD